MNLIREFRPGRPGVLGLLLALVAFGLSREERPAPLAAAVEVRGEVPAPGWYSLTAPSVHGALEKAGVQDIGWPDAPLASGARLTVHGAHLTVDRSPQALALGQPLPLNVASAEELEALPGVGPSLASAIVADREERGDFGTIEALDRVRGIGPAKLAELRPYLATGP